MKCKKLTIETNGTSMKTIIKADGKQISGVQKIDFSADVGKSFITVQMLIASDKKKKMKVRDEKTQKFIEKEEIIPIAERIEFER